MFPECIHGLDETETGWFAQAKKSDEQNEQNRDITATRREDLGELGWADRKQLECQGSITPSKSTPPSSTATIMNWCRQRLHEDGNNSFGGEKR